MRTAAIEEQNRYLMERQRNFRIAADVVCDAWASFAEVEAVAVIGSVARALWKEVPRFREFRRERIEVSFDSMPSLIFSLLLRLDCKIVPLAIGKSEILEAGLLPAKALMLAAKTSRQQETDGDYAHLHILILRVSQAHWNKA